METELIRQRREPAPIRLRGAQKWSGAIIRVIGLETELPYLVVDMCGKSLGWISDGDAKRLAKWSKACAKSIKRKHT